MLLYYQPGRYNSGMQPVPRKPFVECPRCRSSAVHVPWEPALVRRRRRMLQGLAVLWPTAVVWVALGLASGNLLWMMALAVCAFVTLVVAAIAYSSARTFRCSACRLRWRL